MYLGWVDSTLVQEIYSESLDEAEVDDGEMGDGFLDNQNWALRQHLLYHMLNYTLPPGTFVPDSSGEVTMQTSLLFPLSQEPALPPTPPPGPPWLPRGGEGMLGGHGQRLRLVRGGSDIGGERGKVGVDRDGKGGVEVWDGSGWPKVPKVPKNGTEGGDASYQREKGKEEHKVGGARWTRNGVVIGVQGVLEPPPSIGEPHVFHLETEPKY